MFEFENIMDPIEIKTRMLMIVSSQHTGGCH